MNPITLSVAELKPALVGLGKIISRRTTLPVLGHLLVQRNPEGRVTLTATDLDSTATFRLEQPSEGEPASLLVPFAELQKTVKSCNSGEEITLLGADKQVMLRYPIGSQFAEQKIESLPVEEFPQIPVIIGAPVKLDSLVRSSVLDAMQCASTDETRVTLRGACLDVSQPTGHYVVATDGRHLYSSNSFQLELKESLIIPDHKFLRWREFSNDGEWSLQAQAASGDGHGLLQISSQRWSFITRQIEGNYPNWRQVVPDSRQFHTTVSLPQEAMETVLTLIPKIPCHDDVNQTIGLRVEGRKLLLRGRSAGDSKWTDLEIEGAEVKGSPVAIYLNRHFLTKALKFGLGQIDIIDPLTPLRFSQGGRQMIVMPIRAEDPRPAPINHPDTSEPSEPAGSEVHQPAPDGANNERGNMPKPTTDVTNTNGNGHRDAAIKPAIEVALERIELIKGLHRETLRGLNDLADTLKQVQREQKSTDKEVQSVRTTLEKLQSVRL